MKYQFIHILFVKFKKTTDVVQTALVFIAVVISGTPPLSRYITVPFGAEVPSGSRPRPGQSHLLPKACFPKGTDNNCYTRDERVG